MAKNEMIYRKCSNRHRHPAPSGNVSPAVQPPC
ncbi:hypothetical protein NPIL_413471, partial [Nephila pilipes]